MGRQGVLAPCDARDGSSRVTHKSVLNMHRTVLRSGAFACRMHVIDNGGPMDMEHRKTIALDFLRLGRTGDRAGLEGLVTPTARHHNPYFAAGMPALFDAMEAAAKAAPERTSEVKHVVAEGDYVAVHSHVRPRPGDVGVAVVHLFRFEGDLIAELWDVGQPIPVENPNQDGMF